MSTGILIENNLLSSRINLEVEYKKFPKYNFETLPLRKTGRQRVLISKIYVKARAETTKIEDSAIGRFFMRTPIGIKFISPWNVLESHHRRM
jgi:hypothetical protein